MIKSLLPAKLRAGLRLTRDISKGVLSRFLRTPGFELYCLYNGFKNYSFFKMVQADGPKIFDNEIAAFKAPEIPKIIWMYWKQGEAQAPFVVGRCIESWRRHNPDWELRILDQHTMTEYVDMSDLGDTSHLAPRFEADVLRLRLLKTYGGVWSDATVFCHRPLESWYGLQLISGFFAFRHPAPDRDIENWFMISEKDHIIVRKWEQALARYVKGLTVQPWAYFVCYYVLQWEIKRDAVLRAAWLRGASLPPQPCFFMMQALSGKPRKKRLLEVVKAGLPVSKLTWNTDIGEAAFDALSAELELP